ncbi:MAG: BatD family protein [Phycisphaerales bacterium]|nr:BatD family protein [Phycisphaerales bacterium]
MNKLHLILSIVLFLSTPIAYGQNQEVIVETEVSRERVYVGDKIVYQVLVYSPDDPAMPVIEFPDSTRVEFRGRSSQSYTTMELVDGRRRSITRQRFSYQYSLSAIEPGLISIPAPVFEINGQTVSGTEAQFESILPSKSDSDRVVIKIDRTDLYLNESITVECTWWIGDNTSDFNLSSSDIDDSFEILGVDSNIVGSQRVGFELGGQRVVGTVVQDASQGSTKLVFQISITPTKLGIFEFGPIRVVFTRNTGTGSSFRSYTESDPIQIKVIEVPKRNQPTDYSGAIGNFRVQTKASNSRVNVGDPIELTLRIIGDEPMTGIQNAPNLNLYKEFAQHFKISSEGWRESLPRKAGLRDYSITIRATDSSVDEIPAIGVPSFNPTTQEYRTYASNPIPLQVNAVEEITLSDAVISGNSTPDQQVIESKDRVELTTASPGLWAHQSADQIASSISLGRSTNFQLSTYLTDPRWISVIATGPSIFLLSILIVAVNGNRQTDAYEARKAWKKSKSFLRAGNSSAAIRVYLSGVLGMNQDAVTREDVSRLVISSQCSDQLTQMMMGSEKTKWDEQSQAQDISKSDVETLLREVHRQVIGRKGGLH